MKRTVYTIIEFNMVVDPKATIQDIINTPIHSIKSEVAIRTYKSKSYALKKLREHSPYCTIYSRGEEITDKVLTYYELYEDIQEQGEEYDYELEDYVPYWEHLGYGDFIEATKLTEDIEFRVYDLGVIR